MAAVDGTRGIVGSLETRPYGEIKKGYTYFVEGDVLFAKITPCMQNGKHAVAQGLIDGIGFGSTEFHVLRPTEDTASDWIHLFLRQPSVLSAATVHFTGAVGQQRIPEDYLADLTIPLPPLAEQKRITHILKDQIAAVERARSAAQAELEYAKSLPAAYLRESMAASDIVSTRAGDCLIEVKDGVGASWEDYPILGATRAGLAPGKEAVGKAPERYKLVDEGTIFYNPMRILIGSIALVDKGEPPGITSPDYVVLKTRHGLLHHRWFYYWLRSPIGEEFIRSLARGAVRERMLFRRLADGVMRIPDWAAQLRAADRMAHVGPLVGGVQVQLSDINALPAALLRRAFTGAM